MSQGRWGGARLAAVLAEAQPGADAVEVVFAGDESFARSIPLGQALDGPALIAWSLDGEPIPRELGGPLRVIVPGNYAVDSVKWLRTIVVATEPFDGLFQVDDYCLVGADGIPDGTQLHELPVTSLVTDHGADAHRRRRVGRRGRACRRRGRTARRTKRPSAKRSARTPSPVGARGRPGARAAHGRGARDRHRREHAARAPALERARLREQRRAPRDLRPTLSLCPTAWCPSRPPRPATRRRRASSARSGRRAEGRRTEKSRWAERVEDDWGAWGTLYFAEDDRKLGFVQFAPSGYFQRARSLPAGPPSEDAVLITCAYLLDRSSPWVLQSLFLSVIGEARDRGVKAIEAFGYRYPEGESGYERFWVHKTIFPSDFLADFGFRALRWEGRVALGPTRARRHAARGGRERARRCCGRCRRRSRPRRCRTGPLSRARPCSARPSRPATRAGRASRSGRGASRRAWGGPCARCGARDPRAASA